jgi:PEP-CTERM motif-containing protein
MKMRLVLAVLAVLVTLSASAVADLDEVLYQGVVYCLGVDNCPNFATWGGSAAGYVELLEPGGGSVSDYIWVDFTGELWFESKDANGNFGALPPAGLPLLGTLIENGSLQEVDQWFPGGGTRPLFVESPAAVPEPSTLLLFGPAAVFLFNRARRLRRG